jgi:tetratricopeptide (TPR) repeat protein
MRRSLTAAGCLILLFFLCLCTASVYGDVTPEQIESLTKKLERWEAEEAWTEVQEYLSSDPGARDLFELASHIAFYRGDYREALRFSKAAMEVSGEDEQKKAFTLFIEETISVLGPFKRYESPHFVISLDEKQDGILADYLIDALEKTYRVMATKYGFESKEKIRVEVFPDSRAFYRASTLSARDIEVTGAVGLTKFNKLQLLSPRALMHGYRWLDSISHEYMHYLIVKLTANKAPIWYHEGLSKYEETSWRDGPNYLAPPYDALLANALAADRLISFARMEPSLVQLDTPEDVQLAYAEAASAIHFIITRVGQNGLQRLMRRMAFSSTSGASEAVKEIVGLEFGEFEKEWKTFLASLGLKESGAAAPHRYKLKEGKVDDDRLDMQTIRSLVARNRTYLGDRLKENGRLGAAIIEYRRALADSQDSVPIMIRLSSALIEQGRDDEALTLLKKIRELAPDHPVAYVQLGKIYVKKKQHKEAKETFENAIQINPFIADAHDGLADASDALGTKEIAAKERELARKLTR